MGLPLPSLGSNGDDDALGCERAARARLGRCGRLLAGAWRDAGTGLRARHRALRLHADPARHGGGAGPEQDRSRPYRLCQLRGLPRGCLARSRTAVARRAPELAPWRARRRRRSHGGGRMRGYPACFPAAALRWRRGERLRSGARLRPGFGLAGPGGAGAVGLPSLRRRGFRHRGVGAARGRAARGRGRLADVVAGIRRGGRSRSAPRRVVGARRQGTDGPSARRRGSSRQGQSAPRLRGADPVPRAVRLRLRRNSDVHRRGGPGLPQAAGVGGRGLAGGRLGRDALHLGVGLGQPEPRRAARLRDRLPRCCRRGRRGRAVARAGWGVAGSGTSRWHLHGHHGPWLCCGTGARAGTGAPLFCAHNGRVSASGR